MKLKTHKGMAKRIKKTKRGKLKRRAATVGHLLRKKSSRVKRAHEGLFDVAKANEKQVKRLIPYK
ncbi:50S ribosomal protein L35 [subsurface metagenome]